MRQPCCAETDPCDDLGNLQPPGTGKSQTIVSLIALLKLHFRVPHPILLAAPTHVSVDHLVSLLVRAGLNPLRCGKAHRVSPEVRNWTIEQRQEEHPLWKATEAARVATEEARVKLQEFRDAVRGTKEATNSASIKKDGEFPCFASPSRVCLDADQDNHLRQSS